MTDAPHGGQSQSKSATGRVLVVDDAEVIRIAATYILEHAGYEVICATNGAEALRVLRESSVDAVLLDLQMPVMDGLGFLRALRADPRPRTDMRIVAMSADDRARPRVLEEGAQLLLQKPFSVAELLRCMRES
jgi:CheY-like chemotaxis protein